MRRAVLVVLLVLALGGLVCWMASETPGGRLAQAGVVAVGFLAVAGLVQATTKGWNHET